MTIVLGRIRIRPTRSAQQWIANPYAVHQRLCAAFPHDPRLLFRIEDGRTILVQGHQQPDWDEAFSGLDVLDGPPEHKTIEPAPEAGATYRFRLLANPVVTRVPREDTPQPGATGLGTESAIRPRSKRLGLLREEDQRRWLERKLLAAGAEPLAVTVRALGHQKVWRSRGTGTGGTNAPQTHFAVLFEGLLRARDPLALRVALDAGIGPGKGYGLGLLSIARMRAAEATSSSAAPGSAS